MSNIKKLKIIGFTKGLYFYVPVFTLFLTGHGISLSQIIFAQIFYSIFSFLGELPTGIFADKFGQKASLLLGYITDTIGMALLFFMPTVAGLYLFHMIRGLSGAFLSGSEEALFYESYKKEHPVDGGYKKEFGSFLSNDVLGFIVASFIAGGIIQTFGKASYGPIILLTAIATFITFLIALTLKDLKAKIRNPEEGAGIVDVVKSSIKLVRYDRTIFALTIVAALTLNGEYFLRQTYQPYFEQAQVAPFLLGLSLSLGSALNFFIIKYSYLLEKLLTLDKILLLFNFILGISYIGLAISVSPIFIVVLFILLQGLFNAQNPIISDYVNERTSSRIRTTVLSAISFSRTFFQIIMRLILGVLVGVIGLTSTYMFQGVYLIVGILIGYWLMVKCGCVHKIKKHYARI
jgi:MFS family permease